MECREFITQLDDYLDGRIDERPMRAHLAGCADCRSRHEKAMVAQQALRRLSPPEMHPGFVDRAMARAIRPNPVSARPTRRAVLGMALAASLVIGVTLGAFLSMREAPVQSVALAVEQPETVRLVFNTAKPLQRATLNLELPENVEVVGYGGRRELTWQADLREGQNLLQLPLVARGAVKEELLARVSHGTSSKTFRVKIEVANAGTSGM
jgi:putative zinc finger protein